MSDKEVNANKEVILDKEEKKSTSDKERSLDLFDDVWGDEESFDDTILDNEFDDFKLDNKSEDKKIDDIDAAFDQVISHYEMSSMERKRIEDSKKKVEEDKKNKEIQEKKKMDEQAKRNKELEERKKKRERKNKKFGIKKPIQSKSSTSNRFDKYDDYADDFYDY
tara:strand:- start:596 stop:1090 length:495 start_codon:yes stop_codon:yes gene_type:complete